MLGKFSHFLQHSIDILLLLSVSIWNIFCIIKDEEFLKSLEIPFCFNCLSSLVSWSRGSVGISFVDKFKEISLMLDFEELSPDVERVSNLVNFELLLISVSFGGFSF